MSNDSIINIGFVWVAEYLPRIGLKPKSNLFSGDENVYPFIKTNSRLLLYLQSCFLLTTFQCCITLFLTTIYISLNCMTILYLNCKTMLYLN